MGRLPTANGRVQVAYLHPHVVSHSWHESMMRLMVHDLANEQRIMDTNGPFMIRCDSGGLVESRNLAVQRFLDETPYEWLFLIDTDMGFAADTVDRLVDAADPAERPVVGALCFGAREVRHDGMGGVRVMPVPTLFQMARTPEGHVGFGTRWDVPENSLVQVAATGAACLLIHRTALEKIRAEHGDRWFDQVRYQDGRLLAEDLSFCARLGQAGFPIFVHTGIRTTHHKQIWIGAEDYTPPPLPQPVSGPPGLPQVVDAAASLATLVDPEWGRSGMLKLDTDLDRYAQIIAATRPEVIVETGTRTGASARWFRDQPGVQLVISVDINNDGALNVGDDGRIHFLKGDAADPALAEEIYQQVGGRRCMVSLDSDHSAAHVAREIDLYGPLVTAGCYLVVEDTIFAHAPQPLLDRHFPGGLAGSPLDAVAEKLAAGDAFSRDIAIERAHRTSHHPAGWWVRNG